MPTNVAPPYIPAALYAIAFLLAPSRGWRSGVNCASTPLGSHGNGRRGERGCHQYFATSCAQGFPARVTVPAVIAEPQAVRRRRLPLVLVAGALGAVAVAGCGEKSEPAVHPPATAPTTTAPQTTTVPSATTTKPAPTPTVPVPKTTP